MAAVSQPFYAPCRGGLKLGVNKFDLLATPGAAVRLRNFEVSLKGGYRRINGYTAFGGDYADSPIASGDVYGVFPYALGVVVVAGTNVYYTEDGITYLQVNKDTTHTGVTEGALGALPTLSRTNAGRARFVLAMGELDHTPTDYGVLYIATGNNRVAHFHIDGTGGGRLFTYDHVDDGGSPTGGDCLALFDHHLCIVDKTNETNTIYYSHIDDYDNFIGAGAGSIVVPEAIVGIKPFREALYIFCEKSIHKLVNINDNANIEVIPVTNNLGCIEEFSIQEIGGDLVFLGPDGIRPVSATERNNDIELGTISRNAQPLVDDIIANVGAYTISSVVIKSKNQYRLFYSNGITGHGVIGTLVSAEEGWQWSEIRDLPVTCISGGYNLDGEEVIYHSDETGLVYLHDTGNDFDGLDIVAEYLTAYCMYGDLGMRKTFHYLNTAIENEGLVALSILPNFDFGANTVLQPGVKSINIDTAPSVYGDGVYGVSKYASNSNPMVRIPMQGSFHNMSLRFYSEDSNAPYTIQGFHVELFPSGRK